MDQLYHKEILKKIGIDINKLNLKGIKLKDCNNCLHKWKFLDSGLSEKITALYLHHLKNNKIKNFCVGSGFFSNKVKDHAEKFIVCFETNGIKAIESAIKDADSIKAIYSAIFSTKLEVQNIQNHRDLEKNDVERIFVRSLRNNYRSRQRMWHEIEEGLRRILGTKPDKCNISVLTRGHYSNIGGCKVFTFHGDELRDLLQDNSYAVDITGNNISTDVLILGHYHLEMVMERYNTLVIFGGCFVSDRIGYRDEFLSHIGAPIFTARKKVSKVCMQRAIPIEEDY